MTPTVFGVRTDKYKYIRYYGRWDTSELYDIENDPDEIHNLIERTEYQEVAKGLAGELFDWLKEPGGMQVPLKRVIRHPHGDYRHLSAISACRFVALRFASGTLMLAGEEEPYAPAELRLLGPREAELTLIEGRYHQVRRKFAACGAQVLTLHRARFGHLGELAPGTWRPLPLDTHDARRGFSIHRERPGWPGPRETAAPRRDFKIPDSRSPIHRLLRGIPPILQSPREN